MKPMIDIHCHILPGIDDGAADLEESMGIIRAEVSGGIQTFVATPHFIDKVDYDRIDQLPGLIEMLHGEIAKEGLDARIVQGGEVYPAQAMLKGLDRRRQRQVPAA